MKRRDRTLTEIASKHLNIPTLRTRKSDSLDFHDVSVWAVRSALKAAFDAGTRSAGKNAESQDLARKVSVEAAPSTSLLIRKGMSLVPGKFYLRLYHGRNDPEQQMDEWGFVGPTFGPLSSYVHTYCCTFRIHGESDTSELWLDTHDDMIRWDGCFYGDMEAFIAGIDDKA
ncbi:MAG TPA: hypothetical protein VHX65_20750 [Pirellulales bacterium]|jgi:hypothetical protein|nr:hypothetical protein [Pirellulales bacterium]